MAPLYPIVAGTRTPRPGEVHARPVGYDNSTRRKDTEVLFILWLIAVILVIYGIVTMLRGAVLAGVLLIILGLLVGPGGVSIFS